MAFPVQDLARELQVVADAICTGDDRLVTVEIPKQPLELAPHAHAVPSVLIANPD